MVHVLSSPGYSSDLSKTSNYLPASAVITCPSLHLNRNDCLILNHRKWKLCQGSGQGVFINLQAVKRRDKVSLGQHKSWRHEKGMYLSWGIDLVWAAIVSLSPGGMEKAYASAEAWVLLESSNPGGMKKAHASAEAWIWEHEKGTCLCRGIELEVWKRHMLLLEACLRHEKGIYLFGGMYLFSVREVEATQNITQKGCNGVCCCTWSTV